MCVCEIKESITRARHGATCRLESTAPSETGYSLLLYYYSYYRQATPSSIVDRSPGDTHKESPDLNNVFGLDSLAKSTSRSCVINWASEIGGISSEFYIIKREKKGKMAHIHILTFSST